VSDFFAFRVSFFNIDLGPVGRRLVNEFDRLTFGDSRGHNEVGEDFGVVIVAIEGIGIGWVSSATILSKVFISENVNARRN
jgi:hypothetical protein